MKTKIAIGCLIQWYEVEIIEEYLKSLREAIDYYDGPVEVDLVLANGQQLEKIDVDNLPDYEFEGEIFRKEPRSLEWRIGDLVRKYGFNLKITEKLLTIGSYRRKFNDVFCEKADVLVFGESDMIVPRQMFTLINDLHKSTQQINVHKYISTLAICKMWDNSWLPLEHPEFTTKPFIEGDTENWWSLRYTMSLEELNSFNDKVEEPIIKIINPKKFNGCGLIISSEVVKAGVNIPRCDLWLHEDSAFLHMLKIILPNAPQYHFSNILLVHNRKHPKKRSYILGEAGIDKTDLGALRRSHPWYTRANKMSEENAYNLTNINYKSHTYKDMFE